jgi:deoxycytidylate deaminase
MKNTNKYFILAPREMSSQRVKEILRKYLPRGVVYFGITQEEYVAGFEGQPQFRTLARSAVEELAARSGGRLQIVEYRQADAVEIIKKLDFDRAIVVNGSFHRSFHLRPEYQAIVEKPATVRYVSPFVDEAEAIEFALRFPPAEIKAKPPLDDQKMLEVINQSAAQAFINDFQTAAAIVKDGQLLTVQHNPVVPYETYAWHFGLSREKHADRPGQSDHYDAVHAETTALIAVRPDQARGATIYMRTFPCPHCARNLVFAGIKEIVYELDYGDKYSYNLLDKANVQYRRFA